MSQVHLYPFNIKTALFYLKNNLLIHLDLLVFYIQQMHLQDHQNKKEM